MPTSPEVVGHLLREIAQKDYIGPYTLHADYDRHTGCSAFLILHRDATFASPIELKDDRYTPSVVFHHATELGKCQCVDFNALQVHWDAFQNVNRAAVAAARRLYRLWPNSEFDLRTHYRQLWFSIVSMAVSKHGRPERFREKIPDGDHRWPARYAEALFLELWERGLPGYGIEPPRAVKLNQELGLSQYDVQELLIVAAVRTERQKGTDYMLWFAEKAFKTMDRILRRRRRTAKRYSEPELEFAGKSISEDPRVIKVCDKDRYADTTQRGYTCSRRWSSGDIHAGEKNRENERADAFEQLEQRRKLIFDAVPSDRWKEDAKGTSKFPVAVIHNAQGEVPAVPV
ncbi:hypothetical protein JX266_008032 [Neoarthrinium moseri]|nr:hypothetical protein JX266_008032 [Neoarthrinium moseri]